MLIGIAVFAALAWGANEPWAMGIIAAVTIGLVAVRLSWDAWRGSIEFRAPSVYLPLLLFLAYCAIGLRASAEAHSTLIYLLLALSYIGIIFLTETGFGSRQFVKALVISIFVLGIFEAVYGLVQYLGDYDYIWWYEKTVSQDLATGTLINRNHYALLMNLCICSGLGYLYYRSVRLVRGQELSLRRLLGAPGVGKLAWIIFWLAVMGLALVFSMSRMGIVAMLFAIGAMMLAAKAVQHGKRTAIIGMVLIFAILGLAVYTGIDAVLARYENIAKERESDKDRIAYWRDAWKMIKRHPVLGQGLATFQWTYPAYESVEADRPATYAHSDYVQGLAEVGIVGLALLLWAFAAVWRVAVRNLRDAEDPLVRGIGVGTLGALTAIALQETTDFALYIPAVAMTAALVVGLNLRAGKMRSEE